MELARQRYEYKHHNRFIDFTDLPLEISKLISSYEKPNKYEILKKKCVERLKFFIIMSVLSRFNNYVICNYFDAVILVNREYDTYKNSIHEYRRLMTHYPNMLMYVIATLDMPCVRCGKDVMEFENPIKYAPDAYDGLCDECVNPECYYRGVFSDELFDLKYPEGVGIFPHP